jgi:hypothetical protein
MTWNLLVGWWTGAGMFESLILASQLVDKTGTIHL